MSLPRTRERSSIFLFMHFLFFLGCTSTSGGERNESLGFWPPPLRISKVGKLQKKLGDGLTRGQHKIISSEGWLQWDRKGEESEVSNGNQGERESSW